MKVLIINRYMGVYGGAETVVKELAAHLNARGITARILALNISDEVKKLCSGLDIITPAVNFAYTFRSQGLWQSLGIIREIWALRSLVKIHSREFDVINAHNFPANWICGGLDKPVVWMCNEVPDFYNNPKPSFAVRLLRSLGIARDRYIVNRDINNICVADEYNASKVILRYKRVPEVIHYGIDYDFFSQAQGREEAVKKYNLENSFVLLQVGMLSPEKNQLKSIQAIEALKEDMPNIKLILAGRTQSPYDDILKQVINERKLQDYVIFTGHIPKNEVRSLYHACNIALFPVKSQGGWLAPFEALCAGKPIITSSTMGASSIISRQGLGMVSDDLVKAVKITHDNYAYYGDLAAKAGEWVKNNLTWGNFTKYMIKAFNEACASYSSR